MPGISPARNSAPSDVPVTAEYRIIGEDGGIIGPMPADDAVTAAEKSAG